MTDAERIAKRLGPDALRIIADYLESVKGPATSELRLDHGLEGRVTGVQAWMRTKVLDARPPKGASSRR